jgi:hypothetical protein
MVKAKTNVASREEPRQFYLDRCQDVRLAMAADFLMPVAMAGGDGCPIRYIL